MRYLKTYKLFESIDHNESDQIAHDELFDKRATLAFDFNREYINDVNSIKDLIEKYNHFYVKQNSWFGGPPPIGFINHFNQNYSKKGNASLDTMYPTIDLIIETKNYGKLILGFSIIDKSYKLFNWSNLVYTGTIETRDVRFNRSVLSEIGKYVREHLNKMTLEEVIDELNLDVTNYFEWEWKETLNESRFLEFRKVLSRLKDLSLDFEDNNCHCEIFPKDDIQLNIVSLKSRGYLGSIRQPFYLEIDIDRRIIAQDEKRTGFGPFPEWFIEKCREIESYMESEGFETKPSVRYGTDWENFETIDELSEVIGLIYKIKLEFISI